MELTVFQLWLIIVAMATVFLSGLFWCFCCGTCVGRSLLRQTFLYRFVRDGKDNSQWSHIPREDNQELRYLNTWNEEDEEDYY